LYIRIVLVVAGAGGRGGCGSFVTGVGRLLEGWRGKELRVKLDYLGPVEWHETCARGRVRQCGKIEDSMLA